MVSLDFHTSLPVVITFMINFVFIALKMKPEQTKKDFVVFNSALTRPAASSILGESSLGTGKSMGNRANSWDV